MPFAFHPDDALIMSQSATPSRLCHLYIHSIPVHEKSYRSRAGLALRITIYSCARSRTRYDGFVGLAIGVSLLSES